MKWWKFDLKVMLEEESEFSCLVFDTFAQASCNFILTPGGKKLHDIKIH